MKNKVQKALSPEEATIVSNIQSLLAQLTQGSEGEEAATMGLEEPDGDELKLGAAKPDEDEEVEKAVLETTPSDGVVAGDDAESAFEEVLPDSSAANAKEVAKAIMDMIQPERHAPASSVSPILAALTQVVKKSVERQTELETTLTKVLEGLGVAKQLKLHASEESSNREPIVSADNARVMKALSALISQSNPQPANTSVSKSMHEQARDNLSSVNVLAALVGAK